MKTILGGGVLVTLVTVAVVGGYGCLRSAPDDEAGRADGEMMALQIVGGADIVEGFATSDPALEPGTVMVIDEANPGEVRVSTRAYDRRVAGVVSGAGGITPGIGLGQEGVMDRETPVVTVGRAYVRCSVQNGKILPGDLLTTSDHPGHAMRSGDAVRAHGAIVGKAMTSLDAGTGLVLVLVNLH